MSNFTKTRIDNRLSPEISNDSIKELLKSDNNFLITRIGLGGETIVSSMILNNQIPNQQAIHWFFVNAGFYGSEDLFSYSKMYKEACGNSDLHAYWNFPGFVEMENFLIPEEKKLIDPSSLEAFRFENPWTEELKDKKILIISPFKNSIDKQLLIREKLWSSSQVLPEAHYLTYKSVQSIGGRGPHSNWYESFDKMCDDISKIDFEVALLGCGSYGLPLGNFIKNKLNRSAIYIGGGLQLYFGIKGKRWDDSTETNTFYNEYWTRPNLEEKPTSSELVEGGCYW